MQLRLILLSFFFVILISCENKPLPPSLWKIGNSKKKFQKVFDHYSKTEDSLKQRAADFLIRNMDDHFYYLPENVDEFDIFFRNIPTQLAIDYPGNTKLYQELKRELLNNAISEGLSNGSLKKPQYVKRADMKTIKPEFLIENIEYAFKAWDFPWAQNYSFEEFCRYILPYRYANEAPGPWRKVIYERYKWVVDSIENPNNPMEVASFLNKQFNHVLAISENLTKNGFKLKISNQLDANVYGDCYDQAGLGVCVLRSLGIPSLPVNIPKWGDKNWGHEYTAMLDAEKSWHYFNFGETGPEVHLNVNPPKMFFKRFDKMERYSPVLEDVSDKLMKVVDLEIKVDVKGDVEIYLCVFGSLSWFPLYKGENRDSTFFCKNVGVDRRMYLAAIKSKGNLKPVSNVFSTDKLGNLTYYKPNQSKLFTAIVSRKYPEDRDTLRLKSLIGGQFSISDRNDFADKKHLYRIERILNYADNTLKCSEREGKFFRYDFPLSFNSNFSGPAEISFYTMQNTQLKKIEGKYFGSPQLSEEHIKLMTDNDLLTYVEVWDCEKNLEIETGKHILRKNNQPLWLGLEADSATKVTHVGVCPRNDKNGVYPGMRYELLYWDDEWKSLGKQVAISDSIRYEEIPRNSVLWLRNLDEGKEERIFTMKDSKQVWW
jgi:hypothetical protein